MTEKHTNITDAGRKRRAALRALLAKGLSYRAAVAAAHGREHDASKDLESR